MVLHPEINLKIKLDSITGDHEKDRNTLRTLLINNLIKERAGTGNKGTLFKKCINI